MNKVILLSKKKNPFGAELLTNPSFNDGVNNWLTSSRGDLTEVNGVGNIENATNTGVVFIGSGFSSVSGKTYKIDLKNLDSQGRDFIIFIGSAFGTTTNGGTLRARTSTNDINYSFEFTSSYTGTLYPTLCFYDSEVGDIFLTDDWSVKEIL